ncbi:substrate-binding domain-containing protein [Prevotella sp. A2931]|uniref:histidine kinase n=1 Tax=Prevotella illustrans TaxID=2800387 RepID=A0ABS3M7W2_9BACT|nr:MULTISPECIES: substrate-binding domain-containing protein [Prevotella]MBO1364273.1 substrate-binding domain-containing protein [Prevotella illustrans]PTL27382.1 response regulator receiver protein [Prevotella sp. oral taxon 820]
MKASHLPSLIIFLAALLLSCSGDNRTFEIGVSQCSEDIWRDKFNQELRTGSYGYDGVTLHFASADDSDTRQIEQINRFVNRGVDLIIVAPNQTNTITPAIENAYRHHIPVIVYDRKSGSNHYSAYIGADNREIGRQMGNYIATRLQGRGRVVEVMGLRGSSPAIERHEGFAEALRAYPGIELAGTLQGDWTGASAERAMRRFLKREKGKIDFVFGQNDRMVMGARDAVMAHDLQSTTRFCGVDALPTHGGGLEQVRDGLLEASYIYPTHGDKVIELAMKILTHQPYEREKKLKSALVTRENANVLLLQAEEVVRQSDDLNRLHDKINDYLSRYNTQRWILMMAVVILILLVAAIFMTYRYYYERIRINEERERMQDQQLNFFTNVSHEIRTPLTLITDPINHIVNRGHLKDHDFDTLRSTARNANELMTLVSDILDFKKIEFDTAGNRIDRQENISDENVPEITETAIREADPSPDDNSETLLIVDDNADIRHYLRVVLHNRFHIIEAANGQEGLRLAREHIPVLIISDIMMPVMNGLELCQQVKGDTATSHIPVILLTAKSEDSQVAEGYKSGADSYITKPFSSAVLMARIDNIMQSREQLRRHYANLSTSVVADGVETSTAVRIDDQSQPSVRDQEFIGRLHDIIQRHMIESEFSVEVMGSEIGLSRVQLYRKVKALTGLSPVELLRKSRLNKADQLLRSTGMNISEIAYTVGFTSPSYFSKCFKDEFGIQPVELMRG